MGQAPTFTIELPHTDESDFFHVKEVIEHFIAGTDFEFIEKQRDTFYHHINCPDNVNTGRTGATDCIKVQHLDSRDEYAGNEYEGIIITYKLYYWEEMETLKPKIDFLDELRTRLETELDSDQEVLFRSSAATI